MSQLASERPALSQDEVFTILKNPRRREVIRYLLRTGGTSSVRELTTEVAAVENGVDVSELTYAQRKAVYTSLYQTHLPKLDEAGVVDYDRRSGDVALTDRADDCDVHLTVAEEGERPSPDDGRSRRWATVLVGVAHLNLVVAGGALLGGGLAGRWSGPALLAVATALTVVAWYYRDGVVSA